MPAEPQDESGGGDDPTLHQLSAKVDRLAELVSGFIGGSQRGGDAGQPDIKAEVRAAVREVQRADRAAADREAAETEKQQSIEDRISALEHVPEEKPFEYKRSTSLMGWAKP